MVSLVSRESIEEQLKHIGFKVNGWGRSEVNELPHIILPEEEIYECVNGIYEGGFALLLATDTRVLLVDKKIMGFLTVEDLRFDMINEIDFSHRLVGAYITIATGNKTMVFRSYNKVRLRKLIGHVQHCMSEMKKQQTFHAEGQNQHLEKINQQLQAYLMAQYTQQQKLQEQLEDVQKVGAAATNVPTPPEPVRPSPELADYLYANGLLREYQHQTGQVLHPSLGAVQAGQPAGQSPSPAAIAREQEPEPEPQQKQEPEQPSTYAHSDDRIEEDIYASGLQEVFGKRDSGRKAVDVNQVNKTQAQAQTSDQTQDEQAPYSASNLEVNPLRIAYSKLPQALRNRKFGYGTGLSRAAFPKRSSSQSQVTKSKSETVAQN